MELFKAMSLLDYVGFLVALLGNGLLGRFITKKNWGTSVLAGLCISGSILAITGWFAPIYTRQIIFILFCLGFFNLLKDLKSFKNLPKLNFTLPLSIIFSLLVFRHFSYENYFYNNHDPAYWGYAFELLRAEYFGPIKVPTFYPEQFAPMHILPSTAIVSLLVFTKNASLIHIIEIKYLLVSILFGNFYYRLSKEIPGRQLFLILGLLFCFYIYELEIGYNTLISSYFYMLILIEILLLTLNKKPNHLELLFLSLILIIARGPIFYLAAALFIYYFFFFRQFRYNKKIIATGLIVICVMSTWVYFPRAFARACQDLGFNLMNPFDLAELTTLVGIRLWALPDTIVLLLLKYSEDINYFNLQNNLHSFETFKALLSVIPLIIYFLLKYYLPLFLSIKYLASRADFSQDQRIKLNGILMFAGLSIIGWLFVRNGIQIAHQTHSYLLVSIASFFLLSVNCTYRPKSLMLLFPIAIIFATNGGIFHQPFQETFSSGIPKKHTMFDPIRHQPTQNKFYVPKPDQEMWETEIEALLSGSRVKGEDYSEKILKKEFYGEDQSVTSIMPSWIISNSFPAYCETNSLP